MLIFNTVTEKTTEMKKNTNNDFKMINMKRETCFGKIENEIEPGNKKIYHMNCKNIIKNYKK